MKKWRVVLFAAIAVVVIAGITVYLAFFYVPTYPRVEARIAEKLVNPNASPEAVSLYDKLRGLYCKKIISGQQTWSFKENPSGYEDDVIYQKTGKLPYLNGFDLGMYTSFDDAGQINAAISWYKDKGGIVEFSWHWLVPSKDGSLTYEGSKTAFDIKKAVASGTDENKRLTEDLKKAADGLDQLSKAGVPVLWRPMHEADIDYFWWSKGGPDAYKKLWSLMYDYFVNERGLNNLIWVWNGQSKAWLVPEDQFDIASMDIYPRTEIDRSSQVNLFNKCQGMAPTKMVALSECEFIPEPANLVKDKAYWLWYMSWHTTYVYVSNGDIYTPLPAEPFQLNPKYITREELMRIMSDPYVITLGVDEP